MHYLLTFVAGAVLSGAATGYLAYIYGKKVAAAVSAAGAAVKKA
jgi:hypothetical protein